MLPCLFLFLWVLRLLFSLFISFLLLFPCSQRNVYLENDLPHTHLNVLSMFCITSYKLLNSQKENRRKLNYFVFVLATESSKFHISRVSHVVSPSIFCITSLCCPSSTTLNHQCLLSEAVCSTDKRPPPPSAICGGPNSCYGNTSASHAILATSRLRNATCWLVKDCKGQLM